MKAAPRLDALAATLARLAAGAACDADLQEVLLCVLDTLAVGHAARDSVVVRKLADAQSGGDGPADSALLMATTAHVLDYDDVQMSSVCHASAVILPALLAVRQRWPGGDFAAAFQAGLRTIAAMGRLFGPRHYMAGWHATATLGPFGAAAAIVRLADGDASALRQALALAACQASGMQRSFGTDAKPLQAGLAASAGVRAALWALAGLSGGDVLEPRGFLQLYGAGEGRATTVEEAVAPALQD